MKRNKILKQTLLVTLCAFLTFPLLLQGENNTESGNNTGNNHNIELTKGTSTQPRTLVQDIEAYHTNTMVYLTFNENLGLANIVISNTNTGALVETSVPTNCGNIQVDISSLGQGDFKIVISTAEGIYTGAFCL